MKLTLMIDKENQEMLDRSRKRKVLKAAIWLIEKGEKNKMLLNLKTQLSSQTQILMIDKERKRVPLKEMKEVLKEQKCTIERRTKTTSMMPTCMKEKLKIGT